MWPPGGDEMHNEQGVSVVSNRWFRILGVSFVMYVLAYIDRSNMAMAISPMRSELGMSAAAIGFASGVFF